MAAAAAVALTATAAAPGAHAQDTKMLDGARAAGQVGERYDGMAVAHGSVPSNVASLIDQVNAQRLQVYAERAKAQGVPADAIGRIYAAEIIRAAPKGTWFMAENGQWTQK